MERPGYTPKEAALPEPLAVNFENIPKRLQAYDHFVVWKYERIDGDLKKPPFDPKTGKRASVSRSETWGSFADAQSTYQTGAFAGVGIVLSQPMGIVAVDIDHCIRDGQIDRNAHQIIDALNSYTEVSPSGTGIRIMLEGKLPAGLRRQGNVEMYEDMRYVTLTGQRRAQTPAYLQPRHQALYSVYHRVFGMQQHRKEHENTGGWVEDRPAASYQQARTDQQVLQKALSAKNGETFRRYYYGDTSLWEDAGARHASQSEADFTLVLMLLYWTNNDTNQVDRLFRQSGLMREKWHRPIKGSETYGDRLIHDAIRKGRH